MFWVSSATRISWGEMPSCAILAVENSIPDRLLLDPVELNAAHAGNQVERILYLLCFFVHLGKRETLGYEGDADHRHIAVVVVDEWADHALGQARHHVDDLVSNVLPDLIEVAVLVSDVDVDFRAALPRIRIDGVPAR